MTGGSANDTITGGAGADVLTGGAGADTFVYAGTAGESTITARDIITDFSMTVAGGGRDILDLPTATIKAAGQVGAGALGDNVTEGAVVIGAATVAVGGLVTFQAADDTTAVTIDSADALAAALQYIVNNAIVADGDTVFFAASGVLGTTSNQNGFVVFQGNATADIAIELAGLTGATTLATVGADTAILIA